MGLLPYASFYTGASKGASTVHIQVTRQAATNTYATLDETSQKGTPAREALVLNSVHANFCIIILYMPVWSFFLRQ